MGSNAVSESARSAVIGYKIEKGDYALSTPNLPQRIAILSEANTDKQTGLSLVPFLATSLSKVADKMGAGSPAYMAMRILKPIVGGGATGIPIMVYPVEIGSAATATIATMVVGGTATKAASHNPVVAGRKSLDGQNYGVSISDGETAAQVAAKIIASINAVYGCPVIASLTSTSTVVLTSKVKGISSIFDFRMELNGVDAGITYAITKVNGTVVGKVVDALNKFQSDWNTIVINPYGADTTVLDLLETFNGKPDPTTPTGRFSAITFKPFVSFFSTSTLDPLTDVVVSGRATECTNVYCPAPNVKLLPVEVASNMALLVANTSQSTPNLDVLDLAYPDAIVDAENIGNYSDYDYRDSAIKAGLSTVDFSGGKLVVKDLVTTYNPTDEVTPQFKYVRDLLLDWNIRYAYRLLEQVNVVAHTLVPDGSVVSAEKTISPSQWKGVLHSMFDDLADRGLIADAEFSKKGLTVSISSTNPNRFETFFPYMRTGIARICSTTAEAGFYYGV